MDVAYRMLPLLQVLIQHRGVRVQDEKPEMPGVFRPRIVPEPEVLRVDQTSPGSMPPTITSAAVALAV